MAIQNPNVSMIKETGKAGLAYAHDSDGNYVSAECAVKGEDFYCPFCKCELIRTKSKKGKLFFARRRGTQHIDPRCQLIEQKGVQHSFDNLDPDTWISSLCHTSRKKGPGAERPDEMDNQGKNTPPPNKEDTEEFIVRSFSSLNQIAKAGLDLLNPDDMQGNHKISDFIITYRYADIIFDTPSYDLGARIVYARFICSKKPMSLLFFMFNGINTIKFRLLFTKSNEYDKYRKLLNKSVEDDNGRTRSVKRDVLIACDEWYYIDRSRCKALCSSSDEHCRNCHGMYQAVFTSDKQIYVIKEEY